MTHRTKVNNFGARVIASGAGRDPGGREPLFGAGRAVCSVLDRALQDVPCHAP